MSLNNLKNNKSSMKVIPPPFTHKQSNTRKTIQLTTQLERKSFNVQLSIWRECKRAATMSPRAPHQAIQPS